ncbi:hypothetical protein CRYUN_Cryun06bG0142900 [Craigia yunnanensis]
MEEEKKYVEERQQKIKSGSGVMKSIGEKEQAQRGKMISEQGHPQDQKIDIRTKMLPFHCDGENGKNLKTSLRDCSMHLLEEEKKEALQHEGQQQRKLQHRKRDSIIVCALPAQQLSQSRTNIYQKAHKLHTDSISASLESRESGQILLQELKLCSPQRAADLQVTTSERFTQKHEEKQEQQFQKPEKLLEYEIKSKEANFGGEEAAVSLLSEVKDSMNVPLDPRQHGREH